MNDDISLFTIIALVVAVFAILKLRSVLGRRTDEDDIRANRRFRPEAEGSEKVVTLPQRGEPEPNDLAAQTQPEGPDPEVIKENIEKMSGGNAGIKQGLTDISGVDSNFDPENFIEGAKSAYELIVTAFAEGNRQTLKDLLSQDVYDGFSGAIDEREKRKEIIDQSFVGIQRATILEADADDGTAGVTVRFVSQLITAIRDSDGEIISGSDKSVKEVTDIWSFSRDISTAQARANPNWKLVATQEPN
ncbi:MAG: Tim44/TimA family putative adaptor protein [Hyphomicrobiaceae bacterium]